VATSDDVSVPPELDPPAEVIPLFAVEREKLLDLLSSLTESEWYRPTACPEWTVLGLACHLLGGDFGLLARHRDRHYGTSPPEGATELEFIAWLDDMQMEWVRAAQRLSPRVVVDLLAWSGPQVIETLRSEDPSAVSAQVSWAGPQPVPVWLDHLRELSEYWIHRQQLLEAIDRPNDLDPATLGPILLAMRWAYPYRLGRVPAAPGDTVRITITGPVAETWFLVSDADDWDFRSEAGRPTVATLTVTADHAWRLLSNNLPADAHNDLELTGDPAIIDVLRDTRAIIGEPK
jgi:uncharacterized protein (TIGR03083 family)